ncbi:hypothetical protein ACEWY4_006754 [Coilia grayii]|uniref:G-protein coupled receptors family 1 profile domain-containing protein n=1 Tax=Coilia grayii TaxID=363190 RepID=A0ABD1KEL8_9TELE
METLRQTDVIVQGVIFSIGMPAVSLACYAVIRLIRVDDITPVYVINVLLSDLLQVLIRPLLIQRVLERTDNNLSVRHFVFLLGLFGSVGFMFCITLERYVAVAHPLWYQKRHTIKRAVQICVVIWILILTITLLNEFLMNPQELNFRVYFMNSVLSLFVFMSLVMCYFGTWRKIRSVRSLPAQEKKRIMHLMGMVVGTYGVLFLPLCAVSAYMYVVQNFFFIPMYFASLLVQLNPMVDPFLYIFIRKDVNVRDHCCVTCLSC